MWLLLKLTILFPTGSWSLGYYITNLLHTVMYCSDVGYRVCWTISERSNEIIFRFALDVTWPLSMARDPE